VLVAPFDVALTPDSVLQPDLLVSRRIDLTLKKSRYEAAGCPSYWVVDPDEPGLTAWELRDGMYVEVARAAADDVATLVAPYEVTFSPAQPVS
jgi:Putative restriction endonuclease